MENRFVRSTTERRFCSSAVVHRFTRLLKPARILVGHFLKANLTAMLSSVRGMDLGFPFATGMWWMAPRCIHSPAWRRASEVVISKCGKPSVRVPRRTSLTQMRARCAQEQLAERQRKHALLDPSGDNCAASEWATLLLNCRAAPIIFANSSTSSGSRGFEAVTGVRIRVLCCLSPYTYQRRLRTC